MQTKFQSFVSAVAYQYMTNQDFQPTALAAGIEWAKLPNQIDAVKSAMKYEYLKNNFCHERAVFECQSDLNFLELSGRNETVPQNIQALESKFNDLFNQYEHARLAQRIINNPQNAQEIFEEFEVREAMSIQSCDAFDLVTKYHAQFLEAVERGEAIITIPGFEMLSQAISGFNPGRLILFLAPTGYGKTQANLNIAIAAAQKFKVGYVNQEMSLEDLSKRVVTIVTERKFNELYAGKVSQDEVASSALSLKGRLFITEGKEFSIPQIKAWLLLNQRTDPFKLLIVDYDQRLVLNWDKHTPEWLLMKQAVQALETISKELKLCVILVAQLNREGEIAASHRATYAAHCVLQFKDFDDEHSVIYAVKNRHAKKNAGVKVTYCKESGKITEYGTYEHSDEVRGKSVDYE